MPKPRPLLLSAVLSAQMLAAAAVAQTPAPAGVQGVLDCRKVTDDSARLACFDRSAGALQSALAARDVVVVDREQARAARREAFGFTLPSLNIFDRVRGGEDLDEITLTVASASQDGGMWTVRMENGQVWRQNQPAPGYIRIPRGAKAEINRGLLGSYFMKVAGARALRVERVR